MPGGFQKDHPNFLNPNGLWAWKYPDIKVCVICNTNDYPHHSKGLCRHCYEVQRGQRRWRAIKADKNLYNERKKRNTLAARVRRLKDPKVAERERLHCKIYYAKHREERRLYRKKYYQRTILYHRIKAAEFRFSGNYMNTVERDNYTCQRCKKKLELGRKLNVHHIDGKGLMYPIEKRNNSMDNLITLCTMCHFAVDKKHEPLFL